MAYLEVGHKIKAQSSRKGEVTGTITSIDKAGKGVMYVSVTLSDDTPWRWKVRSLEYGGDSPFTFVEQHDTKEKALVEQHDTKVQERAGYEMLRKLDLQPGDEVLIEYSNMTRTETVMGVNFKTGKVGIKRYTSAYGASPDDDFMRELNELLGYKRKAPRDTRWLPATIIKKVMSRVKDSYKDEKTLPYAITPIILRGLADRGWYQQTYSNGEFQVASCVFALTPQLARKGTDYEVASKDVWLDPQTGYFWRETGSFD